MSSYNNSGTYARYNKYKYNFIPIVKKFTTNQIANRINVEHFIANPLPLPPPSLNISLKNTKTKVGRVRGSMSRKLTNNNNRKLSTVNNRKQPYFETERKSLIDERCMLVERNLQNIIQFSTEKSISGAKVIQFTYKDKNYISKHIILDDVTPNTLLIVTLLTNECHIYKNIINSLIDNYVTPYCIRCVEFKIYKFRKYTIFTIINETYNNNMTLAKLADFLKNNLHLLTLDTFCNLLFQITYTLQCFNYINLKHNDLHPNNILVFCKPSFINATTKKYTPNGDKLYFKYGENPEDELYLDNIGVDLRIFDFDRSVKHTHVKPIDSTNWGDKSNPADFYNKEYLLGVIRLPDFDNSANNYIDIYKIFSTIFSIILIDYKKIGDIILKNLNYSKNDLSKHNNDNYVKFMQQFSSYNYLSEYIYILFKLLKINDILWKTITIKEFQVYFAKLYIVNFNLTKIDSKLNDYNIYMEILQHYYVFLKGYKYNYILEDRKYIIGSSINYADINGFLITNDVELLKTIMRTPDEYLKEVLAPILYTKPFNIRTEIEIYNHSVIGAYDFTNLKTGNSTKGKTWMHTNNVVSA
jgi:hypothetical protein